MTVPLSGIPLEPQERLVEDDAAAWLHVVAASNVVEGTFRLGAFRLPTGAASDSKLSGFDAQAISPRDAAESRGEGNTCWQVLKREVTAAGSRPVDDSWVPGVPHGHLYVDFRHVQPLKASKSTPATRALRLALQEAALGHGQLYPGPSGG